MRPAHVLRLPAGLTLRGSARSVLVVALLLAACALLCAVTVLTGTYKITTEGALGVLAGDGTRLDRFIVLGQRLPRVAAALLVGAALGLSGALFQSLSRNPLGSPDIVGFTTGSATGALVALLVGVGGLSVQAGALLGGLGTAAVVHLFTLVRGAGGNRLVLTGIAVGAMLASVNDFLLTRADLEAAENAKTWLHGSLNAISWPQVVPLGFCLLLLVPPALATARPLRLMEMGGDVAAGLGVPVGRVRMSVLLLGVGLTGAAIAAAGPIGFLALAAPQLARRLTRTPGIAPVAALAMGATLLTGADLLAQRLLAPFQIPVGLVTGVLGGAYLLWLLATDGRRRRTG
ncbi:FecCD family ABC transporter permease [Nonomuraea terrae]|uniref:FecCD family ABC transporter permease n=1 Tax=Nonomuraea terrae TaxID=2530383 RepID=UPI0037BC27D4